MMYVSLRGGEPSVSFRSAVVQGQAPDGSLYYPVQIPQLPLSLRQNLRGMDDAEIAFQILKPYVGADISPEELRQIVAETIAFPIPLIAVSDRVQVLELFHGPALAFKDVGARFMSRCLSRFAREAGRRIVVLVATSGDTGGAVADAFKGVPGVSVVVLYPSGKVSPVQERQIAALGGNVHALEVPGDFDRCQALVKQAFADAALREQVYLTSANSINVVRWLPQQIYFALALKQWPFPDQAPLISVPSGNFGNIGAGLLLERSGLPAGGWVAACNANDFVPRYLECGALLRQPSVSTLSNAMDVADPSNFVRIQRLFEDDRSLLCSALSATRTTDEETRATIRAVFERYGYVLDPHTAVAWHGLNQVLRNSQAGIVLSTAHPVKFPQVVEEETGNPVPMPGRLQSLMDRPLQRTTLEPAYAALRAYLLRLA